MSTAEHHQLFRKAQMLDRRNERESLPMGKRLGNLMKELMLVSHTASANIEALASGGDGLPSTDEWLGPLSRREVATRIDIIKRQIYSLEAALDVHQFGPTAETDAAFETTEQKDRRICTMEGMSPEQISQLCPELGDALCIRKVRRANKLHPDTGIASKR